MFCFWERPLEWSMPIDHECWWPHLNYLDNNAVPLWSILLNKTGFMWWASSSSITPIRETCCLYEAISWKKLDNRCRLSTPPVLIQPRKPQNSINCPKNISTGHLNVIDIARLILQESRTTVRPWYQFSFYFVCTSVIATDSRLWSSDSSRQSSHCSSF